MLVHLRTRIIEKLSRAEIVMLATSGPAGVQISACPARPVGLRLYILLSVTSEHLVNLEHNPDAAIIQDLWRLSGTAAPFELASPFSETEARWHRVVEVRPRRFEFLASDAVQVLETIDVEETDLLD